VSRPVRASAATLAATLVVAAGLAACTPARDGETGPSTPPTTSSSAQPVFPSSQVQPLVDAVVHRTAKPLPTKRLAAGLVPPTNRWFSGLVFGDQPQPVFPLPLSFGLTEAGFSFGQPTVTTTAKNIAGGFKPDVAVDLGAASTVVSAYDSLTVTLESKDAGGKVLGHTLIAEGSPYVTYTAAEAGEVTSAVPFTADGGFWTAEAGGVGYGLVLSDGSVSQGTVKLAKGATATFFVAPADGSAAKLAALAADPVTGGNLDYSVEDAGVRTALRYTSKGDTAFAVMPHQQATLDRRVTCDLGTYPSSYGTLKLCSGSTLAWTAPRSAATSQLDLSGLADDERRQLSDQVAADVKATPAFPADTYFGGKALYRAAMLYQLAVQLGADEAATSIKTRLTDALDQWTDPQGCSKRPAFCFVYDEQAHGLVGLTPSFGSEEFNDHHFHYGYFLYAAGVLAQHDPALATQYAPVMNLLAADLGSSAGSGAFPDLRVFDAYASHSWASGTSPFADGNNQESSSEAVTAWTGLALWARASQNTALETEANWLLSNEAHAGLAYWTNVDRGQPVYDGFEHQVVSLNWGGKRDYGTWFSAEPAAMLGILVIPMSPASGYLAGDPARINANVAEATAGRFDQKFGDYLLMYSGLAGEDERRAALSAARDLDARWIDDGNSRAYLLAWLMSLRTS
jgi:endo-1,3(4)-beta-glucanase